MQSPHSLYSRGVTPRVALFARRPRPARVETRLCPPLTARQALDLYRAFLAVTLQRAATALARMDLGRSSVV